MQYKAKTAAPSAIKSPCLVVGVFAKRRLSAAGKELDQASAGALSQALKFGDTAAEVGDSQMLYQVPGCKCERVLLLGLGEPGALKLADLRKAIAGAVAALDQGHSTEATLHLDGISPVDGDLYRSARDLVLTAEQTSYRFDQLKSDPKPRSRRAIRSARATTAEKMLTRPLDSLRTQFFFSSRSSTDGWSSSRSWLVSTRSITAAVPDEASDARALAGAWG